MYYWISRLTDPSKRMQRFRRWILRMPRWMVFLFVTALGWGVYLCARCTRRTIMGNMKIAMPGLSGRELRRMCRKYIIHESLTVYEQTIEFRRALTSQGKGKAIFSFEGLEHLEEALQMGRGAIVYAPHVGNYFYLYWMLSQKYPCTTVVTAGSEELRELFVGIYEAKGLHGYDYDHEPPLKLVSRLRLHLKANGVLFLLGDFWRPQFPDCILFGKANKAPAGAIMLSLMQKTPIVPFYGKREGWFHHRLVFEHPMYLYKKYDMNRKRQALDELSSIMEHLISRVPEQWLYWFNVHERWQTESTTQEGDI